MKGGISGKSAVVIAMMTKPGRVHHTTVLQYEGLNG